MSSSGHFSVRALHESLDASLRALRTDYVDFLFLHDAPVSVLQEEELFEALRVLVAAGKVRTFGVAASRVVAEVAISAEVPGLESVQFPCNVLDLELPGATADREIISIANHPFGGAAGIARGKSLLSLLARAADTPVTLREKLQPVDDALLADVVLNAITRDTGVRVVVPSMLRLEHLHANVAAMQHSRFSSEELRWLRGAIVEANGG